MLNKEQVKKMDKRKNTLSFKHVIEIYNRSRQAEWQGTITIEKTNQLEHNFQYQELYVSGPKKIRKEN